MSTSIDLTHFDVRPIPCRIKHAMIFERWAALPVGEHFVLVNDHDPVPLYYQFAGQFPGAFTWEYLESPPDEFRVRLTRLQPTTTPAQLPPPPRPPGRPPAPAAELDARGLEPPEPMLRILTAVSALSAGQTLRARTDRKPVHLLPELTQRGITHDSFEQSDGSWITTLTRR